ncbi:hypothetical protein Q3A68_13275 [Mucilaginibacter sp. BT774]|nr:hypothetical protein [Mucilaginibacter sp. BT774]
MGTITPTNGNQFHTEDFGGRSGSSNAGITTPFGRYGYSNGGSLDPALGGKETMSPSNFGKNEKDYTTQQIGLSPGGKVSGGAMYSIGQTWVW